MNSMLIRKIGECETQREKQLVVALAVLENGTMLNKFVGIPEELISFRHEEIKVSDTTMFVSKPFNKIIVSHGNIFSMDIQKFMNFVSGLTEEVAENDDDAFALFENKDMVWSVLRTIQNTW